MKFVSIILAIGFVFFGSSAFARCPERSSFPWAVSDQKGASQALFIPTTKTVVTYRICVSQHVGPSRRHSRARQSNVKGLVARLACGIDGKETAPPCISLPLNKAGTCLDVRTEGAILLMRIAKSTGGRAEGITCRTE
jgi:hypothetical protein